MPDLPLPDTTLTEHVRALVLECCRQHNEMSPRPIDVDRGDDAPLFGVRGALDSLALVTLVLALEQAIEESLGARVTLADARAASQQHSPFRTVGSLAAYTAARLAEESATGV